MNYLPLIFAVATAAFFNVATAKIDKEKKLEIIKKCKEETKASDADVETVKKHAVPESHEGKCFIACGMKQYGMMKDGKMNLDGMNSFFEKIFDDQEKRDKAIKIASGCLATEDVTGADECETAAIYKKCVLSHNEFTELLPALDKEI